MKGLLIRLLPLASAVAIALLVVGLVGWGVLFEISEDVASPSPGGWRAVAVVVFHVLTFPLAALILALGEAAGAEGDGVGLVALVAVAVDAWLYGYVVAAAVYWVRARPKQRAV